MAAMPQTVGAIRKQRADKRKAMLNAKTRREAAEAVAGLRRKPTKSALQKAYKSLDKAVKKGVIHKNKAARLKSRLTKLVAKK